MSANKFPGHCETCRRQVGAGHGELVRNGAGAWVVRCSRSSTAEPMALKAGGAQVPAGRNKKAGRCDACNEHLAVGAGRLVRCVEDSGCMEHHDEGGWHVYCLEQAPCEARKINRRELTKAAATQAAAVELQREMAERSMLETYAAERAKLTAGLTRLARGIFPPKDQQHLWPQRVSIAAGTLVARVETRHELSRIWKAADGIFVEYRDTKSDMNEYQFFVAPEIRREWLIAAVKDGGWTSEDAIRECIENEHGENTAIPEMALELAGLPVPAHDPEARPKRWEAERLEADAKRDADIAKRKAEEEAKAAGIRLAYAIKQHVAAVGALSNVQAKLYQDGLVSGGIAISGRAVRTAECLVKARLGTITDDRFVSTPMPGLIEVEIKS